MTVFYISFLEVLMHGYKFIFIHLTRRKCHRSSMWDRSVFHLLHSFLNLLYIMYTFNVKSIMECH